MGSAFAKTVVMTLLCSAFAARAQDADLDRRVVEVGRGVDVSTLDSQLPKARFDEWFQRQLGPSISVKWEATDCGEQDEAHRGEDIPLCAEASAKLSGDRLVVAQIVVATLKKGIQGKPGLFGIALITKSGQYYSVKRLSELPGLLARNP